MLNQRRWSEFGGIFFSILTCMISLSATQADEPIAIGSRRELFIDRFLIEKMDNVTLQLQRPQPAGVALRFDQPWEGQVSGYVTIIQDGDLYRMGSPLLVRHSS
jgi:hypothetical protein